MLKRIALFLGVVVASLALLASPASAAAPDGCANSSLCGYVDQQFNTDHGYEWIPAQAGVCETVGLRNRWTSVYNNGGRTVKLYKQVGCVGGVWTLPSGDSLRNMSLYQPSWNDNIESVRWS